MKRPYHILKDAHVPTGTLRPGLRFVGPVDSKMKLAPSLPNAVAHDLVVKALLIPNQSFSLALFCYRSLEY